jgi:hypothetical protein
VIVAEPPVTGGTDNEICWSWPCPGQTGFELQYDVNLAFAAPGVLGGADSTCATVTGLAHGVNYAYRVRCQAADGVWSPWSAPVRSYQDARAPVVEVAGYMETRLVGAEGGGLTFGAIVLDNGDLAALNLAFEGQPVGIALNYESDSLYVVSMRLQPPLRPERLLLEIQSEDLVGNTLLAWPYLICRE